MEQGSSIKGINLNKPSTGGGFADPMTTIGDIIYKNASNVTARLPLGTLNQVLYSDGTNLLFKTLDKTNVGLSNVDNTSDANKPVSTAMQTALNAKVDENSAISGATKTKITYDAKGLVTSGTDATTGDITEDTDKKYVTDAEKVILSNTSGTNTGDQDLSTYALKTNVLELDNTTVFTPDANYEPATKKYVDDNGGITETEAIAIALIFG